MNEIESASKKFIKKLKPKVIRIKWLKMNKKFFFDQKSFKKHLE